MGRVQGASADADRAAAATQSNPQARFWAKVGTGDAGCWPWLGGIDSDGYGRFYPHRKPAKAHRYSYELKRGPIPNGLVIDHLCRNRACVNPAHLRAITRAANVLTNSVGLAQANAAKTHCAKGHPYGGDNLGRRPTGQRYCRACARDAWRAKHAPHLLEADDAR